MAQSMIERTGCRIFLSYSRKDLAHARTFRDRLAADFTRVPLKQSVGLRIEDVFFDENTLRGENDWDRRIAQDIGVCEMFILLLSRNSLNLNSYCRTTELPLVLRRQPRPRLMVVLLESVPGWDEMDIVDGMTLTRSGAMPIINGELKAPASPDAMPWDHVIADLHQELRLLGGRGASVVARPPMDSDEVDALLAYRCDQQKLKTRYDTAVGRWSGDHQTGWALVKLLRGGSEDGLRKLSELLRRDYLRASLPGGALTRAEEVDLGPLDAGDGFWVSMRNLCVSLHRLGLNLHRGSLVPGASDEEIAEVIGRALSAHGGCIHLFGYLPTGCHRKADFGAGLKRLCALLAVMSSCRGQTRLIFELLESSEQAPFPARLIAHWALPSLEDSGVTVIEVGPPEPLSRDDVADWVQQHQPVTGLTWETVRQACESYWAPVQGRWLSRLLRWQRTADDPPSRLRLKVFDDIVRRQSSVLPTQN